MLSKIHKSRFCQNYIHFISYTTHSTLSSLHAYCIQVKVLTLFYEIWKNMKGTAKAKEEREVEDPFLRQEWEWVGFCTPSILWVQYPWFGPIKMITVYQEVPGISVTTVEDLGSCKTQNHSPWIFKLQCTIESNCSEALASLHSWRQTPSVPDGYMCKLTQDNSLTSQ